MEVSVAQVDCTEVLDFDSMHDAFHRVFVFPEFYGRNMNAWIDCMTDLDEPDAGMTGIHVAEGKVLTLELVNAARLRENAPDVYSAVVECVAFVNWRRVDDGGTPIIALAMEG